MDSQTLLREGGNLFPGNPATILDALREQEMLDIASSMLSDVWPRFDRQLRIRGIVAYVTGVNVLPFIDFGDPATGGHGSVFVDDLNLHFDGDGTDNFGKLHNVVCLAGCQKVKILVLLGGKLKELPMCNTAGQCCLIFRHDLACRARNS